MGGTSGNGDAGTRGHGDFCSKRRDVSEYPSSPKASAVALEAMAGQDAVTCRSIRLRPPGYAVTCRGVGVSVFARSYDVTSRCKNTVNISAKKGHEVRP